MLRVVVSVHHPNYQIGELDLEVPAELPAKKLGKLLVAALARKRDGDFGLEDSVIDMLEHTIFLKSKDRILQSTETLADAEVWDGSMIVVEDYGAAYLRSHDSSNRVYPLNLPSVILGRTYPERDGASMTDALLDLQQEEDAEYISQAHAELTYNKGQWQLRHLSTVNKTIYNNSELDGDELVMLTDGDMIELGPVRLTFHLGYPSLAS